MANHALKKCKICGKPFRGEGEIGPTCSEHLGVLEKYYVKKSGTPDPDEYIALTKLCDLAQELGKSRGWMVRLTGGDGGTKPPFSPEFTIYQFGGFKFCRKSAIATLRELAKND